MHNTRCRHLTTHRDERCAAGVVYDSVLLNHDAIPGKTRDHYQSYPCCTATNWGGATCGQFELPTPEEFSATQAEHDRSVALVRADRQYALAKRTADAFYAQRFPPKDFTFSGLGTRGTTRVHVRRLASGRWQARCGVAIMGYAKETTTWESDPFDEDFRDNVLQGEGESEMEALMRLNEEGADLSQLLFT
jgi:hypothetical protein